MKIKKQSQNPFPGKTMPLSGKVRNDYGPKEKVSADEFRSRQLFKQELATYNEIYVLATVMQIMEEVPEDVWTPEDLFKILAIRDFDKDLPESKKGKYFYNGLREELDGHCLHDDLTPQLKQTIAKIHNAADAYSALNKALINAGWGGMREEEIVPPDYNNSQILRIGFNGFIESPKDYQLSEEYREFCKTRDYNAHYNFDDYKLRESAIIREMSKQKPYQGFDRMLRDAFVNENLPPKMVEKLNISDLKRIIFNYRCSTNPSVSKVTVFNGARNAFIKVMGNRHGAEVEDILRKLNVDKEEREKVAASMKERGCLPPLIKTRSGDWIEATVHHRRALKNTVDPTQANGIDNFMLVFDRVNEKDLEMKKQNSQMVENGDYVLKSKDDAKSVKFPRYHHLMHKLDMALARAFSSKKKFEKRQDAENRAIDAKITYGENSAEAKAMAVEIKAPMKTAFKPRKVRWMELPEVACLAGFSSEYTIRIDDNDRAEFENMLGRRSRDNRERGNDNRRQMQQPERGKKYVRA